MAEEITFPSGWKTVTEFGANYRLDSEGLHYPGVAGTPGAPEGIFRIGGGMLQENTEVRLQLTVRSTGSAGAFLRVGAVTGDPVGPAGLIQWPRQGRKIAWVPGGETKTFSIDLPVRYPQAGGRTTRIIVLNERFALDSSFDVLDAKMFRVGPGDSPRRAYTYEGGNPGEPQLPGAPDGSIGTPGTDAGALVPLTLGDAAAGFDIRAVAYEIGGDRIGVLPDTLEVSFGEPRNDVPVASITYPDTDLANRSDLLDREIEVAIEITHDGHAWAEVPGGRFLSNQASSDLRTDGTTNKGLTLVHIQAMLSEALIWSVPAGGADSDGKWNFLSVTAGTILRSVWDAAVRRGWGKGLKLDCTPTHDSAGKPWAGVVTLAYDATITLAQVVQSLVDMGMIDVSWDKRTMRVYNADTALTPDASKQVLWRLDRDSTAAPETTAWVDICTDVLVKGENGLSWTFKNTAANASRRIERVVEAGGVSLQATARMVADPVMKAGARPTSEIVREWDTRHAHVLPWREYRVGTWLSVERAGMKPEKLQVTQVSITKNASGMIGHTTFGTVLDSTLAKLAKRTKGIVGAASVAGNTVRPSDRAAKRYPRPPQGVVVQSFAQINGAGRPEAIARVDWEDVSSDPRGAVIEVDGYEMVYWREGTTARHVTSSNESQATVGPLDAGARYRFQVRAVGNDGPGDWSNEVAAEMASDAEPPPVPSKPQVSQTLGVLNVYWNGLGSAGERMPADYARVDVSVQVPATDPQPTTVMARPMQRISVAGLEIREWEVRLRSADYAGNASEWSEPARVTLVQNIDADAIVAEVEKQLQNSQALQQLARTETLKEMTHLTEAMTLVAESLVSSGPYPPDAGKVDSSLWLSPDAKPFVLRTKGE